MSRNLMLKNNENSAWNTKLVDFVCQRCLQPLICGDFTLNEYQTEECKLPIHPYNFEDITQSDVDHYVPKFSMSNPDFCIVSESKTKTGLDEIKLDSAIMLQGKLFDILSGNSEVDHPLCEECSDNLLDAMDNKLKEADMDWAYYNSYVTKLEQTNDVPNLDALEKELADLQAEEAKLTTELYELKRESTELELQIEERDRETARLSSQELDFYRRYNEVVLESLRLDDDRRSYDLQMSHLQRHLQEMKRKDIFQLVFNIQHKGDANKGFAIINNFRIGRPASEHVEWSEINTAWGQIALLLTSLAKRVGLTFKKYKIVPYGSHSYIEVLNDKDTERGGSGGSSSSKKHSTLPLYGNGNFHFLMDPKFDLAMHAFLDCLKQFQEKVSEISPDYNLPYHMEKGKICDRQTQELLAVKIQFNSEEKWTKAMRMILTNLRWLVAWVTMKWVDENSEKK